MTKQKACKQCKTIYKGTKCPGCGSEEATEAFKGKIIVLRPEDSEIAKKLKLSKKGEYTIRI